MTESQSADAEPPPPPKPDLSRYTGLRTHLTLATNEGKKRMAGRVVGATATIHACNNSPPGKSSPCHLCQVMMMIRFEP